MCRFFGLSNRFAVVLSQDTSPRPGLEKMIASDDPRTPSASPASEARQEYQVFKWGIVVALGLACAMPLAFNLVDPDLWGHMRYAQDWLAEGQLPRTATYTFTAADHPWINHENLAELAFALGLRHLGVYGLLAAKCLWGMSILFLMVWIARKHDVHSLVAWSLMLLVAYNLKAFFTLRPQLLSFGLCGVMLVLLDRAFCDWQELRRVRWRLLALLPAVFVAWVNSHGAVVAGLCILGAYLGGRMVELLVQRDKTRWPTVCGLSATGLVCVTATLANPYGLEMHRWLVMSLGQPRPEITEWLAPKLEQPIFWPWIGLLSVASLSLLGTRRRRDWVQIVILALVAWQSAQHLRHIAFLVLLCGFWLPEHVQSALGRLRPQSAGKLPTMRLSPLMRTSAMTVLAASICLQSYGLSRCLTDFPVERNFYPVDAIQFMADRQLEGKLVVAFNWAQYSIAALSPNVQVAFDGRFRTCYPQEVVDMHFDFLLGEFGGKRCRSPQSGPVDGSRVLEFGSPDLVLLDRRYEESVAVMQREADKKNPAWVLMYRDRVAELWGRADRYDDPHSVHYFPVAARVQDSGPRDGAVQWPGLPRQTDRSQLAGNEQTSVESSVEL